MLDHKIIARFEESEKTLQSPYGRVKSKRAGIKGRGTREVDRVFHDEDDGNFEREKP